MTVAKATGEVITKIVIAVEIASSKLYEVAVNEQVSILVIYPRFRAHPEGCHNNIRK